MKLQNDFGYEPEPYAPEPYAPMPDKRRAVETDEELIARHERVKKLVLDNRKQCQKMKPGGLKDAKARFGGSLYFTLLQIESEMVDRRIQFKTC